MLERKAWPSLGKKGCKAQQTMDYAALGVAMLGNLQAKLWTRDLKLDILQNLIFKQ